MYRGTWLLVGVPLLVAALSVARPEPLPPPALPPTFDGEAAHALAEDLAISRPRRTPASLGAVDWVAERFRVYGFKPKLDRFAAECVRYEDALSSAAWTLPAHASLLTGLYPDWWEGRRFDRPVHAWAAGRTTMTVRNIIQAKLCGPVAFAGKRRTVAGTGLIPIDSPLVIILAFMFWAYVLGPMGALLAIPLTIAIDKTLPLLTEPREG